MSSVVVDALRNSLEGVAELSQHVARFLLDDPQVYESTGHITAWTSVIGDN